MMSHKAHVYRLYPTQEQASVLSQWVGAVRAVYLVGPKNTSHACSACGRVDAANRHGVRFCCVACGYEAHADINTAVNILHRWDTSVLPVEASDCRADEAGTSLDYARA